MNNELPTDSLSQTENYLVWISEDPDGELIYNIELDNITLHFFREEWKEFVKLIAEAADSESES